MANEFFTRKEAAAILSVEPLTLRRWERQGRITPAVHINGRPKYCFAELERAAQNTKKQEQS